MQPTYEARDCDTIVVQDGDVGMVTDADYCEAILAAWTYLWRLQWAEVAAEKAEVAALYASHGKFLDALREAHDGQLALTAARLQAEPGRWLP